MNERAVATALFLMSRERARLESRTPWRSCRDARSARAPSAANGCDPPEEIKVDLTKMLLTRTAAHDIVIIVIVTIITFAERRLQYGRRILE